MDELSAEAAAGRERVGPPPEHRLDGEDVAVLLGAVPERITDLVSGLDEQRLGYRHGPAFQTLKEVISHLCAEGTAVDELLRHAILDGQRDLPLRASIDPTGRAVPDGAGLERPAAELLDGFARVRRRTVDLLRGLPREGWQGRVADPAQGELSLLEAGAMIVQHELAHVSQVRNLISVLPD